MFGLADLLTTPDARAALANRDVAAVYRLLVAAGVTQARIARATGQRQSEISAILGGRQVSSIAVLERVADGLGVPRGWLGLAYAEGEAEGDAGGDAGDPPTEVQQRQNLLRHAATVLFGRPVLGMAEPISARELGTPRPKRVGASDVEWVRSVTERLDLLTHNLGGAPFGAALTAHAAAAEDLLRADMRDEVRQQLLAVLARLHGAAGWAAVDADMRDLARKHHMRGMSCGAAAADQRVVNCILLSEGMAELMCGAPDPALKLFQLGAGTAPSQLSRAMFENYAACALARLGLTDEARAALSRAAHALGNARDSSIEPDALPCGIPYAAGCTHNALCSFEPAVSELTTAIGVDHRVVRCSTFKLAELATVHLRAGELTAGLRTATVVLGNARMLRSALVRRRLEVLQRAAAARRDSACQDLAREVAALRAAT